MDLKPWELDIIWKTALSQPDAPDILVSLNAKLQKAHQDAMDAEDELRDWARQHMSKP